MSGASEEAAESGGGCSDSAEGTRRGRCGADGGRRVDGDTGLISKCGCGKQATASQRGLGIGYEACPLNFMGETHDLSRALKKS